MCRAADDSGANRTAADAAATGSRGGKPPCGALPQRWESIDRATNPSENGWLAELNPNTPATLVMMTEATSLLRGADYAAFDAILPNLIEHSGIGAPYAHVTAPLRRLSDRFATEVCLAISAGTEVPSWAWEGLRDCLS